MSDSDQAQSEDEGEKKIQSKNVLPKWASEYTSENLVDYQLHPETKEEEAQLLKDLEEKLKNIPPLLSQDESLKRKNNQEIEKITKAIEDLKEKIRVKEEIDSKKKELESKLKKIKSFTPGEKEEIAQLEEGIRGQENLLSTIYDQHKELSDLYVEVQMEKLLGNGNKSQTVKEALYEECPENESNKKRTEFVENLSKYKSKMVGNEGIREVKLETLLGKKLAKQYRKACKEERDSKAFRNAVFITSTKTYPGKKLEKRIVGWLGGPSSIGKSFASMKMMKEKIKKPSGSELSVENKVTFVDGGTERNLSQMRQLVVQYALEHKCNITNLEAFSNLKVKKNVKKAAWLNKDLSVVIVTTFSSESFKKLKKEMKKYSQDQSIEHCFFEVRWPNVKGGYEKLKRTINKMGESRAFATEDSRLNFEKWRNNREIGVEQKAYDPIPCDTGVHETGAARELFLSLNKGEDKQNYMEVQNTLIYIKKNEKGEWVEADEKDKFNTKGVEKTTDAIFEAIKKYQKIAPDLMPSDFVTEVQVNKEEWLNESGVDFNPKETKEGFEKISVATLKIARKGFVISGDKPLSSAEKIAKYDAMVSPLKIPLSIEKFTKVEVLKDQGEKEKKERRYIGEPAQGTFVRLGAVGAVKTVKRAVKNRFNGKGKGKDEGQSEVELLVETGAPVPAAAEAEPEEVQPPSEPYPDEEPSPPIPTEDKSPEPPQELEAAAEREETEAAEEEAELVSEAAEKPDANPAHLAKLPVKSFNVKPGDVIGGFVYVMDKPLGIEEGMVGSSVASKPYREFIKSKIDNPESSVKFEKVTGYDENPSYENKIDLLMKDKKMGRVLFEEYKKSCGVNKEDKFHVEIKKLMKDGQDKAYMVKQDGELILGATGPSMKRIAKTTTGKALVKSGIGALVIPFWKAYYLKENSPVKVNTDAIIETIATKIASIKGFPSQEIDTIEGTYENGATKIATVVTWTPGCQDLSGHLMGGKNNTNIAVSLSEGHPIKVNKLNEIMKVTKKDAKGKAIEFSKIETDTEGNITKVSIDEAEYNQGLAVSDDSIYGLGESLITLISLGDRDAIGSKGQNKAIVPLDPPQPGTNYTHQFFGIDFGKAYQSDNPLLDSLRDDFSFEGEKFKNYSMLYDNPLSDKMKGVYFLAALYGKLTQEHKAKIVEEYKTSDPVFSEKLKGYPEPVPGKIANIKLMSEKIKFFKEEAKKYEEKGDTNKQKEFEGYAKEITKVKNIAIRSDAKILKTFKNRLALLPSHLDFVSNMEKLTAKKAHSLSPDGKVLLNHIQVNREDRIAWQLKKNPNNPDEYILSCEALDEKDLKGALDKIKRFPRGNTPVKFELNNNKIELILTEVELQTLMTEFTEEKIRDHRPDTKDYCRTQADRSSFHKLNKKLESQPQEPEAGSKTEKPEAMPVTESKAPRKSKPLPPIPTEEQQEELREKRRLPKEPEGKALAPEVRVPSRPLLILSSPPTASAALETSGNKKTLEILQKQEVKEKLNIDVTSFTPNKIEFKSKALGQDPPITYSAELDTDNTVKYKVIPKNQRSTNNESKAVVTEELKAAYALLVKVAFEAHFNENSSTKDKPLILTVSEKLPQAKQDAYMAAIKAEAEERLNANPDSKMQVEAKVKGKEVGPDMKWPKEASSKKMSL